MCLPAGWVDRGTYSRTREIQRDSSAGTSWAESDSAAARQLCAGCCLEKDAAVVEFSVFVVRAFHHLCGFSSLSFSPFVFHCSCSLLIVSLTRLCSRTHGSIPTNPHIYIH
jgi:hypothetical protein